MITKEQMIKGLKILSGDFQLPDGFALASKNVKDKVQHEEMVKWLNKTQEIGDLIYTEGGTYYIYVTEMSRIILDYLSGDRK